MCRKGKSPCVCWEALSSTITEGTLIGSSPDKVKLPILADAGYLMSAFVNGKHIRRCCTHLFPGHCRVIDRRVLPAPAITAC